MSKWLDIIGLGEGGLEAIAPATLALLADAKTVVGAERLLALLTSTEAPGTSANLTPWQSPLDAMLAQIDALRGTSTVILATGDPLWFGIGATLAKRYASDEIAVHPYPSAFQLAAARMRWPLQHVSTVSLHGRAVENLHPYILPGNRILALTSDKSTAVAAADILVDRGYGQSLMTALGNLGAPNEHIVSSEAENFDTQFIGDFYVLAIDCVAVESAPLLPPLAGLPDDAFVSDGQLTKRDVRAATIAKLAPYPGALLWDVGAGCGSVAIEWVRAARDAKAIAFERDADRLRMIALNAAALGAPTLRIESGEALTSIAAKPTPDAIFMGGDVSNEELFDACWIALRPGGRLVANAVTLDGEQAIYLRHERLGGEIVRIEISVLDKVGDHRVLRPRMAVTQWLVIKP
ncbi:precorrin-6y C5,15-methyltransferase (decarboxylating) subunit CbiE [Devosia sp.]|uniref:precorrin-6y C5,15-methyltransferase (decarboxylating) subunit CbiE n=1 Tax=Devosia sp. TaxID=1871048 RepID=UPI0032648CC9